MPKHKLRAVSAEELANRATFCRYNWGPKGTIHSCRLWIVHNGKHVCGCGAQHKR